MLCVFVFCLGGYCQALKRDNHNENKYPYPEPLFLNLSIPPHYYLIGRIVSIDVLEWFERKKAVKGDVCIASLWCGLRVSYKVNPEPF